MFWFSIKKKHWKVLQNWENVARTRLFLSHNFPKIFQFEISILLKKHWRLHLLASIAKYCSPAISSIALLLRHEIVKKKLSKNVQKNVGRGVKKRENNHFCLLFITRIKARAEFHEKTKARKVKTFPPNKAFLEAWQFRSVFWINWANNLQ